MQYGRIRNVDLKLNSRPPAFAFIEYDDPRYVSQVLADKSIELRGGLIISFSRQRTFQELCFELQRRHLPGDVYKCASVKN